MIDGWFPAQVAAGYGSKFCLHTGSGHLYIQSPRGDICGSYNVTELSDSKIHCNLNEILVTVVVILNIGR